MNVEMCYIQHLWYCRISTPTQPVCRAPILQDEPIGGDDCNQEESQETMMEVAEVDESIVNDIVMGE